MTVVTLRRAEVPGGGLASRFAVGSKELAEMARLAAEAATVRTAGKTAIGTGLRIGPLAIDLCGWEVEGLLGRDSYLPFLCRREHGDRGSPRLEIELLRWPEPVPDNFVDDLIVSDDRGDVQTFLCGRFGLVVDTIGWRAAIFHRGGDAEAIDRALRHATILFAIRQRGLFVHSCGLRYRGKGLLCAGESGAGKSTLANLSDRYVPLGDETILLDLSTNEPLLHGTPFRGFADRSHFRNQSAPALGLFFLVQAPESRLLPIGPSKAFHLLSSRIFLPSQSSIARCRALELAELAVSRLPCYLLEFAKDDRFLAALDRELFADAEAGGGDA